jgi:hypothetical protein
VHEYLTSFDADCLLQGTSPRREFRLDSGEYVGGGEFSIGLYGTVTYGGPEAEARWRRDFPWRYHRFREDDVTSALISRYEEYRRGREKLLVMAFFCLSALETLLRGRHGVARALNVHHRVLVRLGELVTNTGTLLTARKISRQHRAVDPTASEREWIERTVREIIVRVGSVRAGMPATAISPLKDLPEEETNSQEVSQVIVTRGLREAHQNRLRPHEPSR